MDIKELESYYFCTPDIDRLRIKHFATFKSLLGVENFFNNEKLTSDEHWEKLSDLADKLIKYIFDNNELKEEIISAYRTNDDYILGELLIQSIVADVVIELKLNIDIFKDKRSILYFDGTYPKNISIYKNKEKSGNMFEYIEFFENFRQTLLSINPEELFGKDFVEEMEDLIKDSKDKQDTNK